MDSKQSYIKQVYNSRLNMIEYLKNMSFDCSEYENFSIEEQNAILLSKRSNIQLSTDKLYSLYPDIPDIKSSVEKCIKEYYCKL